MEHVRWHAQPTLRSPTIIAAFTGWNDAADAASGAVRAMIEGWDAKVLASIDPEAFTDFATTRPHVRLDQHGHREIVWPQTALWYASTPGADVVLILGPEPALRWRLFTEQILGIAEHIGATILLTLGALLADVSHRRPTQVIGSSVDDELLERFDLQRSKYEGPTGIVGVLQYACAQADLRSASLWAATPAFAPQVSSPKAALALAQRATDMIGTPAPTAALAAEVAEYVAQIDEFVSADADLAGYVRRLEDASDDDQDASPSASEIVAPTGDELIHELEQFLRDQDPS
jgi:proteasome assembly chaperone (PAC2) family protein